MLQGAIDSTSSKRTLPLKNDVKKEFPGYSSTLTEKVKTKRQADKEKKIQQKVTSYFNELKDRACLSAEKHPSDRTNVDAASRKIDLVELLKVPKREVHRNAPSVIKSDSEHSEKPNYGKRSCLNEVKSSVANSGIAPMLDQPLSMGLGHKAETEKHFSLIGKPTLYSGNDEKGAQPSSIERCHKLEDTDVQQGTQSEQSYLNQCQSRHCDMSPSIDSSSPSVLNQSQSNRNDRTPSIDSSSRLALIQDPGSIVCIDLATSQSCIENISSSRDTEIAKKISENMSIIRHRITRKRQHKDVDVGIPSQSTDAVFKSFIKQSCIAAEGPPKKQKLGSGSKVIHEVQKRLRLSFCDS